MVKKPWKKHWDSKKIPWNINVLYGFVWSVWFCIFTALEALKKNSKDQGFQVFKEQWIHYMDYYWSREDSDVKLWKKSLCHCMLNQKSCFKWKPPSFARISDQTVKPMIWKSHGGLENLPHMMSHQNILLNERAVLRFLHLSSAVMTYIHPWKLTWGTQ